MLGFSIPWKFLCEMVTLTDLWKFSPSKISHYTVYSHSTNTHTHTHTHSLLTQLQVIRENGTHFAVTFQISNLTSLAQINPATNITAQQAVDILTQNNTLGSNQLPFQIRIYPNVMVTPTFFVLGRGPEVQNQCVNNTKPQPQPCNCTDSTHHNNMTLCPNTTDSACNCSDSMANTTQFCNVTEICHTCNCSNSAVNVTQPCNVNVTESCPKCNDSSTDGVLPCPNNTDSMCPECNCSTTAAGECTFNATQCKSYCPQNNLTSTDSSRSNNTLTNITNRLGLSSGAVAGIAIALFILGIIVGVLLQLSLRAMMRWCRNNCTSVNLGQSFKYKKQEESISLS